jgi:hypothetical protein
VPAGNTDWNWEKIGAIAGVLSLVVAVVGLLASRSSSGHSDVPTYGPTYGFTTGPAPHPGPATETPPIPTQTLAVPRTMPAGCDHALAAVRTYDRTVGSTQASRSAAANQAYGDMTEADTEADQASVYTILVTLARDFQNLAFIASGALDQSYAEAAGREKSDVRTLDSRCTPA